MRKQVAISEATSDDLGREASKHGVSRDKVISKMLEFFRIYGIDPFNYDAPADEMQKIIKRFDQMFAFIKAQEKNVLVPTLTRVSTKEDVLKTAESTRLSLEKMWGLINKELDTLKIENKELKEQLKEARSQDLAEHQNVGIAVVDAVSKMLQITLDKGNVMSKDTRIERIKTFEK